MYNLCEWGTKTAATKSINQIGTQNGSLSIKRRTRYGIVEFNKSQFHRAKKKHNECKPFVAGNMNVVVVEKVPRHGHNNINISVKRLIIELSFLCTTNVVVSQVLCGMLGNHNHYVVHHVGGNFCFLLVDFIYHIIQVHNLDFVQDVLGQNIK